MRLLNEAGLLRRVRFVFSVSGGSILAAHMARRWQDYTDVDPQKFDLAAAELLDFGQWDLRGRITRRYLLGQSRIKNLEKYYSARITGGSRLDDIRCGVQFHILATSLNTGRLCSFTFGCDRALVQLVAEREDEVDEAIPAESFPLSKAVAASSAFPPLFPPVPLTKSSFSDLPDRHFRKIGPDYLTDGGVFDNAGVSRIRDLVGRKEIGQLGLILVSDASAGFDYVGSSKYRTLFSRTVRTTDILMYRIASLEDTFLRGKSKKQALSFPIGQVVEPFKLFDLDLKDEEAWTPAVREFEPQGARVQRFCSRVRTDLDEFDPEIILALTQHGYEVAAHTISRYDQALMDAVGTCPWGLTLTKTAQAPSKKSVQDLERALERSKRRQVRLSNPKDPVWQNLILSFFSNLIYLLTALAGASIAFHGIWTQ